MAKKRLTRKSCEKVNSSKLYISRDKFCKAYFYSREKPELTAEGIWRLDLYSADAMRIITPTALSYLGLEITLDECELAEIDFVSTCKIYDSKGNLKRA